MATVNTKIVLTVNRELTDKERWNLQYLFNDALSEFADRREPVEDYVKERYRGTPPKPSGFGSKVEEVKARIALAREIRLNTGRLVCTFEEEREEEF